MKTLKIVFIISFLILISFSDDKTAFVKAVCNPVIEFDLSNEQCNEEINIHSIYSNIINNEFRTITACNIPNHNIELFGNIQGLLNPNLISAQTSIYEMVKKYRS